MNQRKSFSMNLKVIFCLWKWSKEVYDSFSPFDFLLHRLFERIVFRFLCVTILDVKIHSIFPFWKKQKILNVGSIIILEIEPLLSSSQLRHSIWEEESINILEIEPLLPLVKTYLKKKTLVKTKRKPFITLFKANQLH
jgi:hypothetical protein